MQLQEERSHVTVRLQQAERTIQSMFIICNPDRDVLMHSAANTVESESMQRRLQAQQDRYSQSLSELKQETRDLTDQLHTAARDYEQLKMQVQQQRFDLQRYVDLCLNKIAINCYSEIAQVRDALEQQREETDDMVIKLRLKV